MNTSFWTTVLTAVLSSGGLWGAVQVFLTRRQRKEDDERKKREDAKNEDAEQRERERKEDERRELLAEAQATAQRTALESANQRYEDLKEDYNSCRDGLIQIRDAAVVLINAFETMLVRGVPENEDSYVIRMSVSELGESRRAVNDARRHLR